MMKQLQWMCTKNGMTIFVNDKRHEIPNHLAVEYLNKMDALESEWNKRIDELDAELSKNLSVVTR